MNYGLYLSAAGVKAQMAQQAVITNNLANANTVGFKRDLVAMQARRNAAYEDPAMFPYRMPVVKDMGGGVVATGDGIDLTQSTFESSANATDVALNGRGFFTVGGPNGEKLLTRDGRFIVGQDGTLETATGRMPVLDDKGVPVTLTPGLPVAIDANGQISQGNGDVGARLGVVDVADSRRLIKLGGNVLRSTGDLTEAPAETQVLQYKLEASGVEPMVEIVNMMEGQRVFDANAKMMGYQDQMMAQLNTIGHVA